MSVKLGDIEVAGFSGGSIDAIDNITITKNADDEIQAVATVNQNTASGATNPVFDWVGTLAEYQAQNIETLHPDWICYIIDDVSGGDSVYTKAQVDTIASSKANTALDNITNTGKETAVGWVIPDYTAGVSRASGVEYTAESNGFLCLVIGSQQNTSFLYINGVAIKVSDATTAGTFYHTALFPVAKGDVYKFEKFNNTSTITFTFYPCRTV